jgi:L-malate glycosyltransferase
MHICVIPSWYPLNSDDIGGSFFREQSLALQRYGHKVGVIYPHQINIREFKTKNNYANGISKELDHDMPTYRNYSVGWIPKLPYGNAYLWVKNGETLFDAYIKEHGFPDVIHAHSILNGGFLASRIKEKYGIPFVVTEHSSSYARKLLKKWQYKIADDVVHKADLLIAVSEQFCALLDKTFISGKSWKYIPNILPRQFEIEVAHKPNSTKFAFCNISILTENKGIDVLLKAFSASFKGRADVILQIAGDGPLRSALELLAESLGITSQVNFMGMLSRKEVVSLLKESNAYVLSSHVETFGVVLIESLALGIPVIATKCGGPESIVIDGVNGYLVEKNSIEALSNAMLELFLNYEAFNQNEIRQLCLNSFSEGNVINSITNEYNKILKSNKIDE